MMQQTIPCPVCKNNIHFDAQQLLQGVGFQCSNCFSKIQIAGESMEEAQKIYKDFNKMKSEVLNAKK